MIITVSLVATVQSPRVILSSGRMPLDPWELIHFLGLSDFIYFFLIYLFLFGLTDFKREEKSGPWAKTIISIVYIF